MKKNSVTISQFTYDGDGVRVKSVIGGETIRFVGGYYERKGSQITKYYMAGATRVATRKYTIPQSMTVEYLLGDHLGSTGITTDINGTLVSEIRYKPWGETRYTSIDAPANTSPIYELVKYQYTGQYSYVTEFGLMYYGARFYDSAVGRFVSADSIIPGGTQGYDRYAYAANNPVRNTDPSGHGCVGDPEECERENGASNGNNLPPDPPENPSEQQMIEYIKLLGLTLVGKWTGALLLNLWEAISKIGFQNFVVWTKGKTATLYTATRTCESSGHGCYGGNTSDIGGHSITFSAGGGAVNPVSNILHEFGHMFDNMWDDHFTTKLSLQEFANPNGSYLSGWDGSDYYSLPPDIRTLGLVNRNAGGDDAWQQRGGTPEYEDWADIFSNAMLGNINESSNLGNQMSEFFYMMQSYAFHNFQQ